MATLTAEQIEQKKQLLAEKVKEMKAIYDEFVEAGAIELSEEELGNVDGGVQAGVFTEGGEGEFGRKTEEELRKWKEMYEKYKKGHYFF